MPSTCSTCSSNRSHRMRPSSSTTAPRCVRAGRRRSTQLREVLTAFSSRRPIHWLHCENEEVLTARHRSRPYDADEAGQQRRPRPLAGVASRILITGAAGNLGTLLVPAPLRRGHELRLMYHRTPLPPDLAGGTQCAGGESGSRGSHDHPARRRRRRTRSCISQGGSSLPGPRRSSRKPTQAGLRTSSPLRSMRRSGG